MAEFPEIGVQLRVETEKADKDLKRFANKAEKQVAGIGPAKLDFDTGNIKKLGNILKGAGGVDIDVDADISKAESKIKSIDDPKVTVDVDADADKAEAVLVEIKDDVQDIKALAVIEIAFNVLGGGLESIPILGTIIDTDKAVRLLTSRVSEDIPNAAGLISGIFLNAWGESKEEIALNAAAVLQVTDDVKTLAEDTEAIFAGASVTGEDFDAILESATILVNSGLFSDIRSSVDFIVSGFELGLDRSGDFLDSINEYSSQFEDVGLSAAEGFSAVQQALALGTRDADKVVDLFKEFPTVISAALTAGEGELFDILDKIGQLDETELFEQGELSFAEFFNGVRVAAGEAGLTRGELATLFGSQGEDVGLDIVLQIDPTQVEADLVDIAGRTDIQAAILFGDIGTALTTLERTVTEELAQSVSDTFDIPGKINEFTAGINAVSALIRGGEDIPEAIEIAFQLDGFAATVSRLESGLANFLIGLLQFVGDLQATFGQGEAAASTRAEVTRLATGQLDFDILNAADADALQFALNNAINRGVAGADVVSILQAKFDEAISSGDLGLAQQISTQIQGATLGAADPGIAGAAAVQFNIEDMVDTAALGEGIDSLFSEGIRLASEGDFTGAFDIVKALDIEGSVAAGQLAGEIKAHLDQAMFDAVAEGDFAAAQEFATMLSDTFGDTTAFDTLNTAILGSGENFTKTGTIMGTALQTISGATKIHMALVQQDLTQTTLALDGILNRMAVFANLAGIGIGDVVNSGLGTVLGGGNAGAGGTTNNSRGDTTITINNASGAESVQATNQVASAMLGQGE